MLVNTSYFSCDSDTFLNTSEFLSHFLHFFGCFSIPIHIFGGYCILYKTPVTMASVKWSLLNFHFWSCFLDLALSLLATPYVFLPTMGGYTLGILNSVGLGVAEQCYFITTTLGIVITSVVVIFEYRFFVLQPLTNTWRLVRIPWLVMDYILALLVFIPAYLHTPDQKYAREYYFSESRCVPTYIDFDKLFFISLEYFYQLVNYILMVQFFFWQIFVFAYLTNRNLSMQIGRNSSSHTVKLQKLFQKALITQVSLPTFIMFIPLSYMGFSICFQFHFQYLNNFSIILGSSHGFFSTIAMLTIYRPYREYTRDLIKYQILFRHEDMATDVVLSSNVIT